MRITKLLNCHSYAFLFSAIIILLNSCNTKTQSKIESGANHLQNESSPYLLQHMHNPVDWYPWKDDVLALAKSKRKLMVISIGYSSCHWCHVMERESFSDTSVSNYMNEHFISIKVDREERPDVDQVYMTACQIANANGVCGWPLNVLAMSDGRPFWVGTYMPKNQWISLLKEFVTLYNEDPNELEKLANNIQNHLTVDYSRFSSIQDTTFSLTKYQDKIKLLANALDYELGGKKASIKFPLPSLQRCLLDNMVLFNNKSLEKYFYNTLDKMMAGGINDQLEGGFARYSTDPYWKVPHFEKMLYDNAQLISLYSYASLVSKREQYKELVRKTVGFVQTNLFNPEHYYYSSLDAESEGEEGKYYSLTESEINLALKDESERKIFKTVYNISAQGNWEKSKNVLFKSKTDEQISKELGLPTPEWQKMLQSASDKVIEFKKLRKKPGLDDKMLCSWNAMMIKALADASIACSDTSYLQLAKSGATFIRQKLIQPDYSLWRTYKNSKASVNGFLEDYAFTIDAFIRLYELTFDESYLDDAKKLCDYCLANFSSNDHLFFYFNSSKDKQLITRNIDFEDQVIPSANSVMADNLHRLGLYLYDKAYLDRCSQMVVNVMEHFIVRSPEYYNNWLRIYGSLVKPPFEVAVVGPNSKKLRDQLLSTYLPQAILLGGENEGKLELLKDKLQEGNTFIYVCRNKVCKLPVTEASKALELMK